MPPSVSAATCRLLPSAGFGHLPMSAFRRPVPSTAFYLLPFVAFRLPLPSAFYLLLPSVFIRLLSLYVVCRRLPST